MTNLNAGTLPPAVQPGRRGDYARLALVSVAGILLFGLLTCCLPNGGPVFTIFSAPSGSMKPTIKVDSYVVVSRAAYGYSRYSFEWFRLPITGRLFGRDPSRGDLAAFVLPRDGKTIYLKRVVGLPGDSVQMVKGRLVLNGQIVPRQATASAVEEDFYGRTGPVPTYDEMLPGADKHRIIEIQGDRGFNDDTEKFKVPAGQFFVMGDNRDNSTDSRVAADQGGIGFVPAENFIGRIVYMFSLQ